MNRNKTTYLVTGLILISSVVLYISYISIYGVNCSFHIINDYTELAVYEPLPVNVEEWPPIRGESDIDVMIIINGEVSFEGLITTNVEELINFNKRLKFGKNHIQIFSRELNTYAELSTNVYFGQNFDIWVRSTAQYLKDGELIGYEKALDQISSGELDESFLNEAEIVCYSGFFIKNTSSLLFKGY